MRARKRRPNTALDRQAESREALVDAARYWTSLAGAPSSSWGAEVPATNRAGDPVIMRVHVQYVPVVEEDPRG